MKKISTVFKKDYDAGCVTQELNPDMDWVLCGEGKATLKRDGEAVFYQDGEWFRRFDRKLTKQGRKRFERAKRQGMLFEVQETDLRVLPEGAIALEAGPDPITFHYPHWVPAPLDNPQNKHLKDAVKQLEGVIKEGSYELIGPCVRLNPHGLTEHQVILHGSEVIESLSQGKPRTLQEIQSWLEQHEEEGIVFHHPDGRYAKIRRKDFALPWNDVADPRG